MSKIPSGLTVAQFQRLYRACTHDETKTALDALKEYPDLFQINTTGDKVVRAQNLLEETEP